MKAVADENTSAETEMSPDRDWQRGPSLFFIPVNDIFSLCILISKKIYCLKALQD
jgi:hypothetical protein